MEVLQYALVSSVRLLLEILRAISGSFTYYREIDLFWTLNLTISISTDWMNDSFIIFLQSRFLIVTLCIFGEFFV